jgi:hypothetical protein
MRSKAGSGAIYWALHKCITLKPQKSNANHPVAFGATPP